MRRSRVGPDRAASGRRARLAVSGTALLASIFAAGTVAAPALDGAGNPWGVLLRAIYAPVCHQAAERSLTWAGAAHAVCARCSGLYLGGVIGLAAGGLWLAGGGRWPRPVWLAVAIAPTAIDAMLPWVGLPQLANLPRSILALPAGAVAALFLAAGVADWFASPAGAPGRSRLVHKPPRALEETDG